jgi:hypothetical protein
MGFWYLELARWAYKQPDDSWKGWFNDLNLSGDWLDLNDWSIHVKWVAVSGGFCPLTCFIQFDNVIPFFKLLCHTLFFQLLRVFHVSSQGKLLYSLYLVLA